jgi:hypothetical protein
LQVPCNSLDTSIFSKLPKKQQRINKARQARQERLEWEKLIEIVKRHNPIDDNWSVEHVFHFLQDSDFKSFAQAFKDQDIDGEALVGLTEAQLREYFEMTVGQSARFLKLLSNLKGKAPAPKRLNSTILDNGQNNLLMNMLSEQAKLWWTQNVPEKQVFISWETFLQKALSPMPPKDLEIARNILEQQVKPKLDQNNDNKVSVVEFAEFCGSKDFTSILTKKISIANAKIIKAPQILQPENNSLIQCNEVKPKDLLKGLDQAFVPDMQKALIISNSDYSLTEMGNLISSQSDGEAVKNFLLESLIFNPSDIVQLHDAWSEKIRSAIEDIKKEARGLGTKKGLFFIYYSGHGFIDKNGMTGIYNRDDEFLLLERHVRSCACFANSYFVLILDCCRKVLPKGDSSDGQQQEQIIGTNQPRQLAQLFMVFSAAPDAAAIAVPGQLSPVTASFLNLLKTTRNPLPNCLDEWDTKKAEIVTKQIRQKLYLFKNMLPDAGM